MKLVSKSLEETAGFAALFLKEVLPEKSGSSKAVVVALSGDLGSGKTAFVQLVAKLFGIEETVISPTFIIEKIYRLKPGGLARGFERFIHIDAYRLEKKEELKHLGWEELSADPKNIIFIEWPEKVGEAIPKDAIRLAFTFIDQTTREIIRK